MRPRVARTPQVSLPFTRHKVHSFHQLTSAGGCIPAGSARPQGQRPENLATPETRFVDEVLGQKNAVGREPLRASLFHSPGGGVLDVDEDVKAGGLSPGPPGHQSGLTGPKSSSACPGYKSLVARNLHLATSVCGPPGHRFGAWAGRQRKDDALASNDAI